VAGIALVLVRKDLLGYIDGQYLLVLTRNRLDLTGLEFAFSRNPLQGLGELWYFANTLWLPEFSPAVVLTNPDHQIVAVHLFAAVELFLLVAVIMLWLGLSATEAAAAGWFAVILIAPFSYPSLIYNISPDAPQFVSMIAIPLLIPPLWSAVGQGRWIKDLVLTGTIAVLLWLHFIMVGIYTLLGYPFIAVVCSVFLVAAWRQPGEFTRKCVWGAVLLLMLAASGLFELLPGIVLDTAAYFFPEDLKRAQPTLGDGSLLFRRNEPMGVITTGLGLLGAAVFVRIGTERMRLFALATLILSGLICTATVIWSITNWSGAMPLYYEYPLWPIYPSFAALLVYRIARSYPSFATRKPFVAGVGACAIIPVLFVVLMHGGNEWIRGAPNSRPNVFPPTPTLLTEFLRSRLSIMPGSPFRGRVATITGQGPVNAGWEQAFGRDLDLLASFGNEHRDIGLWYYNIPTLFTFSPTLGPVYYAVVKRYLACEGDSQYRTVINIRCPNTPILRLLGVSYVITDSGRPADDVSRVMGIGRAGGNSNLSIDQIAAPNLGISPTEIVHLGSKQEELEWLGRADTRFEHQAILEGTYPALVPARDIEISIEPDGIRVKAQSNGASLVVVPFEYSHCWKAVPAQGSSFPELRRADVLLLALLFKDKLDTRLEFKLGPFSGGKCKLKDFADHGNLLRSLESPGKNSETHIDEARP